MYVRRSNEVKKKSSIGRNSAEKGVSSFETIYSQTEITNRIRWNVHISPIELIMLMLRTDNLTNEDISSF